MTGEHDDLIAEANAWLVSATPRATPLLVLMQRLVDALERVTHERDELRAALADWVEREGT